jgi:hypothetical protein
MDTCPDWEILKKAARGELERPELCRELLKGEASVIVPVDAATKLAHPQRWPQGESVMPVFFEETSFDCYQSQQSTSPLAALRLRWSELLDWAKRLRLGLVMHFWTDPADLAHLYVPNHEVAALMESNTGKESSGF